MNQIDFKESMELWRTPERVVLVTSIDKQNVPHVITVSWFSRVSFDPPMFAIAIGNNRSMYNLINDSKELVIAIPGPELADAVLGCGKSGQELEDRFEKYGIETKVGKVVKSPLLSNCLVNYECLVKEQVVAGDHTVFIAKVKQSWASDEPVQNLILVGDEKGYDILAESGPYKVGTIKK